MSDGAMRGDVSQPMSLGVELPDGSVLFGEPWTDEPCDRCNGIGVVVVGYDHRRKEDIERQCVRCMGTGHG